MSEIPLSEQFNIVIDSLKPPITSQSNLSVKLRELDTVIPAWLNKGFYIWTDKENGDCHRVTYRKNNDEAAGYMILEMIKGGEVLSSKVNGTYQVEGMYVSIEVFEKFGDANPTLRVFIDGNIVAREQNVLLDTQDLEQKFITLITGSNDNFVQAERRNPQPLIGKMLNDIFTSVVDLPTSQRFFDSFIEIGREVEWVSNWE